MVNKKAVAIATLIVILVVGAFFGIKIYRFDKQSEIKESDTKNDNTIISKNNTTQKEEVNNVEDNTIAENNTTEQNVTDENKTTNTNMTDENSTNNTNTTSKTTETKKKPEDIAIELVKEKWGNQNPEVYFNIDDEESDGKYIVSIRDNNTTTEIMSYKVDVKNKIVTEN